MDHAWFPLALVTFGAVTGTLSGVLGIGGGIFVVPFLVLVGGLDQQTAQGTSLAMVLPTAIVATISLQRKGVADPRVSLSLGILGAGAGLLGTWLALSLPGHALRIIFATLLILVAVRLLRDAVRPEVSTGTGPRLVSPPSDPTGGPPEGES